MDEGDNQSRINIFEKRRKTTTLITGLIIIAILLLLVFLGTWLLGGKEKEIESENEPNLEENNNEQVNNTQDENKADQSNQNDEENNNEDQAMNEDEDNEGENELDQEITEVEEVNDSEDENVRKAYEGNWPAIGTEQEGPHTVNFDKGSQDRIEMKQAVVSATGLDTDNMVEWWVGNGGDQKVISTVSDPDQTTTYRVYLSWIDEEGWQPTRVEILHENDRAN